MTAGRGADYVFVTVGNIDAMKQGASMAGRRGLISSWWAPRFDDMLGLSPFELIHSEKFRDRLFSWVQTNLRTDVPRMVEL